MFKQLPEELKSFYLDMLFNTDSTEQEYEEYRKISDDSDPNDFEKYAEWKFNKGFISLEKHLSRNPYLTVYGMADRDSVLKGESEVRYWTTNKQYLKSVYSNHCKPEEGVIAVKGIMRSDNVSLLESTVYDIVSFEGEIVLKNGCKLFITKQNS